MNLSDVIKELEKRGMTVDAEPVKDFPGGNEPDEAPPSQAAAVAPEESRPRKQDFKAGWLPYRDDD